MRVVLDALSILKRQVGDQVAVVGKVMGPWTISYHLAGVENFLMQVGRGIRDTAAKDRVNRMLDQVMQVPIKFAQAQFQAGADIVVVADHATGDLVSAKVYQEYLKPRHKIITSEIGGPLILHVCGNCKDRIEMFADAGFDAYHFEWQVDAQEAVRIVDRRWNGWVIVFPWWAILTTLMCSSWAHLKTSTNRLATPSSPGLTSSGPSAPFHWKPRLKTSKLFPRLLKRDISL